MTGTRAIRKRERVCPWCSRSFTKDEHLARHIRTHTREKPFTCETCQRTFSRHDSLLRHARRHRSCSILSAPETRSENQSLDSTNNHQHATQQISPVPLSAQDFTEIQPRAQPEQPRPNATAFLNPASVNNGSNMETIIPNSSVTIPPSTAGDLTRASATDLLLTGSYPGPAAATAGLDLTSHTPTWFAGDDFDLDAFNAAIMFSTTCPYPSDFGQLVNDEPINSINYSHQPSVDNRPPPVEDLIRDNWFIFVKEPGSGSMTPDNAPEQIHVDEAYRERLVVKLQHSVPNLPLPSTDFLNLCVQMYFTRFHPIFPVLHAPTFRPSAKRSLLLLSICSIGSLFLGSAHAASQGLKIFETLNKAILSSWEKCIINGGSEAIAMVQAALLGQTFGLLSRRKKDLLTAQTFHGTVVAWARRFNMFRNSCASDHTNHNLVANHPQKAWETWIRVEERNRVAAGLCIHDVEIAELSHSDPLLRNWLFKVPPVSDEILWGAPTADVWAKAMTGLPSHSILCNEYSLLQTPASLPGRSDVADKVIWNKGLRAYLELEGIAACIIEGRGLEDFSRREQYTESLIHLYNSHIKTQKKEGHDLYLLSVLWHSAFISLYADLNRLELAVGKEGHDEAQQHLNYVREWACSQVGQRCALHAVMILRDLEGMRLGTEPPIHVPRILFRAAITWFCYSKFGTDTLELSQQLPLDFAEFKILGINCRRLLFEANGYRNFRPNTPESCTFRGLVDILQRVGHWGISQNYASILSLLLPEGTKD